MEWKKLSKDEASDLAKSWNESSDFLSIMDDWGTDLESQLSSEYRELRIFLLKVYNDADLESAGEKNSKYIRDLLFGLSFYEYMRDKMGLMPSDAADDDIWRYIQMKVVPDLVFQRWQHCEDEGADDSVRIKADSFWKDPRRIWMKSRWWYIHLSIQNNSLNETKIILIGNSMDEISQLVERPGSGYRVELCRSIMKHYAASSKKDRLLLRKIMKLNTVKCSTIEPLLFSSGVENYVESLFDYFEA